MRIPYLLAVAPRLILTKGGSLFHYRPVLGVRVARPKGDFLYNGLLDPGADETCFHEDVASLIGLDLTGAGERTIHLIGRPAPVRCRYAGVQLSITDGGRETYQWTAVVGFVSTRLRYNVLGHGGFLDFFDVEFRGADREAILIPNRSFPGTQVAMPPRP